MIYALFTQVALTLVLLVWTGLSRMRAVQRGEVRIGDIALGQKAWPERVIQIGNSYQNQLELPVLFYVLVVLVLMTKPNDALFAVLAWLFVGLRLGHAFIHVTSNNVPIRFRVFALGAAVLTVMWAAFAWRVIAAS